MSGLGMCKSVSIKSAVQKRRWAVQKTAVEGWKKTYPSCSLKEEKEGKGLVIEN
jgi:hypothetical protein